MPPEAGDVLSDIPPRFVIVVGCQRSGTTLMSQIIGAHPWALLVDETDGVYKWTDSIFNSNNGRAKDSQISELCERAMTKYRGIDKRPLRSATILVLQAPNLTWSHTQISRCFPDARVVYMLRDVRAVVASMLRLSRIPFVENQIRFFRQASFIERDFPEEWEALMDGGVSKAVKMALVARIKMSLAEKFEAVGIPVLRVSYEDLVLAPTTTVSGVTRHVGIPFDRRCLEHDQVLLGSGPGGTDRARPIDGLSLEGWREELMPETVDSIWAAVGEFYEKLGYRRDSANPTAS